MMKCAVAPALDVSNDKYLGLGREKHERFYRPEPQGTGLYVDERTGKVTYRPHRSTHTSRTRAREESKTGGRARSNRQSPAPSRRGNRSKRSMSRHHSKKRKGKTRYSWFHDHGNLFDAPECLESVMVRSATLEEFQKACVQSCLYAHAHMIKYGFGGRPSAPTLCNPEKYGGVLADRPILFRSVEANLKGRRNLEWDKLRNYERLLRKDVTRLRNIEAFEWECHTPTAPSFTALDVLRTHSKASGVRSYTFRWRKWFSTRVLVDLVGAARKREVFNYQFFSKFSSADFPLEDDLKLELSDGEILEEASSGSESGGITQLSEDMANSVLAACDFEEMSSIA